MVISEAVVKEVSQLVYLGSVLVQVECGVEYKEGRARLWEV